MKMMNDLQCAYLLGRSKNIPLGGVGCHAYFEFDCGHVDREHLATAWKKVFLLHEEIRSCYCDGTIKLLDGLPECSELEYHDLSGYSDQQRQKRISALRNERSCRIPDVGNGCCAGLMLINTGVDKSIMMFDWELIAGDVRSFINVLEQLARFYEDEGTGIDIIPSKLLTEKRKAAAKATRMLGKEIISADAESYCTDIRLPMKTSPDELNSCHYLAEDRFISAKIWRYAKAKADKLGIPREVLLMNAFAQAYFRENDVQGLLLNVPWFGRNEDEKMNVGDFTDIKLVPVRRRDDAGADEKLIELSEEFSKLCSFSGMSAGKTRRLIAQAHPECKYIAPIVFSPMLEVPLISKRFERCFGKLTLMLSQTPQVWLDVQSFELDEKLYLSIVYPDEMFSKDIVSKLADGYAEEVIRTLDK